jgi:hypothetical protein
MCRRPTQNPHALELAKADKYNSVTNSIRAQRVKEPYCVRARIKLLNTVYLLTFPYLGDPTVNLSSFFR